VKKLYDWIEHNRWTVIAPIVGLALWFAAGSCSPTTTSPIQPGQQITSQDLERDFRLWQKEQEAMVVKFDFAREDLARQREALNQLEQGIVKVASGDVRDLPGMVSLILGGGFIGTLLDNIRKNGVIGGLKRNH
jgi:hypothetical protein